MRTDKARRGQLMSRVTGEKGGVLRIARELSHAEPGSARETTLRKELADRKEHHAQAVKNLKEFDDAQTSQQSETRPQSVVCISSPDHDRPASADA